MESLGLLDKVFLLPLIMVGSFVVILLFGKRFSERVTSGIGVLAVLTCFVLACIVGVQWIQRVNHPPEGAAMAAAEEACNEGTHPAAEGNEGTSGGAGESHGSESTPAGS